MEHETGICSACKDHCGFDEVLDENNEVPLSLSEKGLSRFSQRKSGRTGDWVSECCGARAYSFDVDLDYER